MSRASSIKQAEAAINCVECSARCQRFGRPRNGLKRLRCPICGKTYTEPYNPALEGSYISQERIVLVLRVSLGDLGNTSDRRLLVTTRETLKAQ